MQILDLNGTWDLRYCDPGQGEQAGWSQEDTFWNDGFAAHVPGDVHLDLIQAGYIEEPLYATNARDCRWMEEKDWWYHRRFVIPEGFASERVELFFAGLDTTADIWLNGKHVGTHNNMFVGYTLNVTDAIREGDNSLVVRLDVGLRAVASKPLHPYNTLVSRDPDVQ